ncbi:MAG: TIM barrel protein [Anaerolineae bacterium]|nr:TIM barrel protein [Anaerolineae bacterium]
MSRVPTIHQSFSWDGFVRTGIAPEALARGAAEIGYAGVDLAPPEFWPLIRDHGLRIVATNGHPLAPEGVNSREHFPAIEARIRDTLDQAVKWHIPYVLCFSGNRYGLDPDEAAHIAAENLARLAPAFESAGVTLVLELLNSKAAGRDYEADHTAWGVQVCKRLGSPRVRLLYDVFHMQIMEGDLIRTIREAHPHIAHYHTAGNPGRGDLDGEQEIHYPAVFRAIAATGHTGYIGHEFFPKHEPLVSLRAAFDLTQAALSSGE